MNLVGGGGDASQASLLKYALAGFGNLIAQEGLARKKKHFGLWGGSIYLYHIPANKLSTTVIGFNCGNT